MRRTAQINQYPNWAPPEGAVVDYVEASDGMALRTARWTHQPGAQTNGTVIILQGRGEFIEKYYRVVQNLIKRGFYVATFDWRGQGGSKEPLYEKRKGLRRFIKPAQNSMRLSRYLNDLDQVFEAIVCPDCPPPYYILGHSSGALFALHSTLRHPKRFERLVLTSPLVRFSGYSAFETFSMRLFAQAASLMGLGGLKWDRLKAYDRQSTGYENNPWSHDREWLKQLEMIYKTTPDLKPGPATLSWLASVTWAMKLFFKQKMFKRLETPFLMISSGGDAYIAIAQVQKFCQNMRPSKTKWICLPIARHDLLVEIERIRGQVWAAFDAFVPGNLPWPSWGEPEV